MGFMSAATDPIRIIDATPTCNIGPAEVAVRRRAALAALVGLGLWAGVALLTGDRLWVASIALPLLSTTITMVQWRLRFCIGFALSGLAGMGEARGAGRLGAGLAAAHRARAVRLGALSLLPSIAWLLAVTIMWNR